MAQLSDLPNELLLMIGEYLDSCRHINPLTRVNRRFSSLFFSHLFDTWFKWISSVWSPRWDPTKEDRILAAFKHATEHDSANIIQGLLFNANGSLLDFKGAMRERTCGYGPASTSELTYLHFALLGDAPRVAAHLMRHGANMDQVVGDSPDLTPLCLTLGQSRSSSQRALDAALRIASSYALPRTTRFLLTRGADTTSVSYGLAPMHIAVTRRLPWKWFWAVQCHNGWNQEKWCSVITKTVSELLKFGAPCDLKATTARVHSCTSICWRSPDCDHRGQTALHLACGGGIKEVVSLLLEQGVDPSTHNDDGYTPLYYALVQGHEDIAQTLLDLAPDIKSPIVYMPHLSTALHIACRYAFSHMVEVLLEAGADPNVIDLNGRTPLHEALSQTSPARESDIVKTLKLLERFDADPDIGSHPQSPNMIGQAHPLKQVQHMFRSEISENSIVVSPDCYLPFDAVSSTGRVLRRWRVEGIPGRNVSQPTGKTPDMQDSDLFPVLTTTSSTSGPVRTNGDWNAERTQRLSKGHPRTSEQLEAFPPISVASGTSSTNNTNHASSSAMWAALPNAMNRALSGWESKQDETAAEAKKGTRGRKGKKWQPLQL